MTDNSPELRLVPIKTAAIERREELLAGVLALELAPGQEDFVGFPENLLERALPDPLRHPFAIEVATDGGAAVVGMGVLHVQAATETGWRDDESAVLLRGFLVDHRYQGMGFGGRATVAAVALARQLADSLKLDAEGVVLGVNERNGVGRRAYERAGFAKSGTFLGGRSGPQDIMYRAF
ncbi:GNAT family N-acetyltransferase [Arthrobacter sp. GMC3]|uniref:GNAT family N-acetyltransferase n=1 Tax=Arthrobacter sp. GMC3 TaxID=2058894 RepID=UPI000CE472A5|nr:GNAT family protein [Arthrobacter sp. GMC3]